MEDDPHVVIEPGDAGTRYIVVGIVLQHQLQRIFIAAAGHGNGSSCNRRLTTVHIRLAAADHLLVPTAVQDRHASGHLSARFDGKRQPIGRISVVVHRIGRYRIFALGEVILAVVIERYPLRIELQIQFRPHTGIMLVSVEILRLADARRRSIHCWLG